MQHVLPMLGYVLAKHKHVTRHFAFILAVPVAMNHPQIIVGYVLDKVTHLPRRNLAL